MLHHIIIILSALFLGLNESVPAISFSVVEIKEIEEPVLNVTLPAWNETSKMMNKTVETLKEEENVPAIVNYSEKSFWPTFSKEVTSNMARIFKAFQMDMNSTINDSMNETIVEKMVNETVERVLDEGDFMPVEVVNEMAVVNETFMSPEELNKTETTTVMVPVLRVMEPVMEPFDCGIECMNGACDVDCNLMVVNQTVVSANFTSPVELIPAISIDETEIETMGSYPALNDQVEEETIEEAIKVEKRKLIQLLKLNKEVATDLEKETVIFDVPVEETMIPVEIVNSTSSLNVTMPQTTTDTTITTTL